MDTIPCTKCGKGTDDARRGLCVACYHQFRRAKLALPEKQQERFDQEAVKRGWVCPASVRQPDNDFADLAQTVAEDDGPYNPKPRRTA